LQIFGFTDIETALAISFVISRKTVVAFEIGFDWL
jgi:hypothetical protein